MSNMTTTVTGTLRYASVLKPRLNFEGTASNYQLEISVSAEEETRLRAMGFSSRSPTKVDETGTKYMKFSMPSTDRNGNATSLPVVDTQGNDITTAIANGSTGTIKVTFLTGGKFGSTARLTSVMVTNHIPYEDTMTPEQKRASALEGLVTTTKSTDGFAGI